MTYSLLRADARRIPLADNSVDLIITSPPYYGQREYDEADDAPIGNERHPAEYLDHLLDVVRECDRVLKPEGSQWWNIGDKRGGSSAPGTTSGLGGTAQGRRTGMAGGYSQAYFGRPKGKQMLPHRFAIRVADELDLIVRQDQVWEKPNGMPESVRDRTRDAHEYWFQITASEGYYQAVDYLREPSATEDPDDPSYRENGKSEARRKHVATPPGLPPRDLNHREGSVHPLGKIPSSVWRVATSPLIIPDHLAVQHFAAFPWEWPRRLITGWCPTGICLECGQGRFPVVLRAYVGDNNPHSVDGSRTRSTANGGSKEWAARMETPDLLIGEACRCTPFTDHPGVSNGPAPVRDERRHVAPGRPERRDPTQVRRGSGKAGWHADDGTMPPRVSGWREWHLDGWVPPPTRPAVVLDPFGGTGTTAAVAHILGRHGVSMDMSPNYLRVAGWRCEDRSLRDRVEQASFGRRVSPLPPPSEGQEALFAL